MENLEVPKLIFEGGFDECDQIEAKDSGYRSHVQVLLNDGNLYPLVFYTCYTLSEFLAGDIKRGDKFIAEPGMVVIPEITLENMQDAVNKLEKQGFFNHLVPIVPEQVLYSP